MNDLEKKKVILHDIQYSVGGPKTVLKGIVNSPLKNEFEFIRLKQKDGCGFNPFKAVKFVNHYRKLINKENADAIYVCGLQYTGFLMTVAAKLSNVKNVVVAIHGSDWDNPDRSIRKWILMHIIEPLTIKMCNSFFTVCESAQRTIGALKVSPSHNAGVVYNTFPNIDINTVPKGRFREEQQIAKDKIIVVVVGRIVAAKGHQYIIEAIKKIEDPNYVFVIVGDGPYLGVYKQVCSKEIFLGKVWLLGVRNDVYSILRDSDIFLFATLNENHSLALLEAVNMECAVLATNVGGNPEIIEDGKSGILIECKNSDAIVKGLLRLKDESLRKLYTAMAAINAQEKFSIENTYGKLGRILKREI